MKEVGNLTIDLSLLTQNPESHGYAFAAWRLPNSDHKQLIIDLDIPGKPEGSFKHAEVGFLVNKFSHHHPTNPLNIKSDIRVSLDSSEIQLDSKVSSSKLDEFKERIKAAKAKANTKKIALTNNTADEYENLVDDAIERIRRGEFTKVVLSRFKDVTPDEDFSPLDFFHRVCEAYPLAFCSLFFLPDEGIWIGATPEVLVDSTERMFKTVSLAGTKKLENRESPGDTGWTQKEIEEQAIVSRYIINCFKKLRLREFEEYGPKTVKAGNLLHLKTEFWVDLSEIAFDGLGDQMMELLHPTSAVCGMPLHKSLDYILHREGFDRSYFAGFIGPVNDCGRTQLFVNLRCMQIKDGNARLFAGAGITEDSVASKEFLETEMKMDVLLRLLRN